MKSILAAATAPYVVTAAGVLMPVRKIVTPDGFWLGMDHSDRAKIVITFTPRGDDGYLFVVSRKVYTLKGEDGPWTVVRF